MDKRISIDPFVPESYDAAIKEIEDYKKYVDEKSQELCKRLAEIGLSVAQIYFIPEAGNSDVTLSIEKVNDGYLLKAEGEDVCFLEFGAGVTAGLGYDTSVIEPPVDISPGSWSNAHGGMFSRKGYWFYGGKIMNSIVPQMGMYHAVSETMQRIAEVAREVFA